MRLHTLAENVQWIIHMNAHVIANCRQRLFRGADDPPFLALDLVTAVLLREAARYDDRFSIGLWFVCIFAFILEGDSDLGDSCNNS